MTRTTWWAVLVTVIVLLAANLFTLWRPALVRGPLTRDVVRAVVALRSSPAWAAGAGRAAAQACASLRLPAARPLADDALALVARPPLVALAAALLLASAAALSLARAAAPDPRRRALSLIRRGQPAAAVARRTRLARDAVRQLAVPGSRVFRPRRRSRKLLPVPGARRRPDAGRVRCESRA
jgi:hypothetical protein